MRGREEGEGGWHYLAPGIGLAAGVPFSSEFVRFAVAPSCQRLAELRTRARARGGEGGARFLLCITSTVLHG